MKYLSFIVLLAVLAISCQQPSQKSEGTHKKDPTFSNELTKKLDTAYQLGAVIGFSVSVVNQDEIIYSNGFGFTDIAATKPYNPGTTQNIASISKTLIGISLLKAQELGKLKLDDPINQYLPFEIKNPYFPEQPILIKHLAYHSSSILDLDEIYSKSYVLKKSEHDDNEGVYDWFSKPDERISLLEFLENTLSEKGKWYTKKSFATTKPGESREYSNIGAALCAQIIAKATGQDYQSFTQEHILKPLKMTSSGWSDQDIDTTKRSRLFAHKKMLIAEYSLITYADGGFITSSKDLSLFLMELMKGYQGKGTLLQKESYETLFEKHTFPNKEAPKAYGTFLEFSDGFVKIKSPIIGHNGSDPGVVTAMYFNPDTGTGKILLVNTDSDFDDNFWPEIQAIWRSLIEYETALSKHQTNN